MNVKIDTKEKFTVITPLDTDWSENMADDIVELLLPYLQKDIKHIVLNLVALKNISVTVGVALSDLQQKFYDQSASFVICEIQKKVENQLDSYEILALLNVVPTESEAWDILQMEEIEREILGGEE